MRDVAIAGYAETKIDVRAGRTSYELAGDALDQILRQTKVDKSEIDGLLVSETMSESADPFWAQYMADVLGITPTWLELLGLGGVSSIGGVARAAMAIRSKACSIALVLASMRNQAVRPPNRGAAL